MSKIRELSGLRTKDGRKVFTLDYIQKLREEGSKKIAIAQAGPQEDGLHQSVDILFYGGNRGGGKANTYSTPVITPTGRRKMGDLEVGDVICTPYEGIQKVEQIFEQGRKPCYRIHFDDDTTLDCMDNHRFLARTTGEYVFRETVMSDIMQSYTIGQMYPNSLRNGKSLYELPLCGEVEMQKAVSDLNLPVHPFVLGAIIGSEGRTDFEDFGFWLSSNKTIANHIKALGYDVKKYSGCYIIKGIKRAVWSKMYPTNKRILDAMDKLGKRKTGIPKKFMMSSPSSRWALLQGLFLFHGGMHKKHPYLDLPNKEIIEDAADVARSLGCFAKAYQITDDPEKVGYFRLQLICPDDRKVWYLPFMKQRSRINGVIPTEPTSNGILTKKILWIEKIAAQKCRCITVSGRDHLYLTDAYTINHNTWTLLAEPMYDIKNPNFNGIIFRKNKDDFNNIIKESRALYRRFGRYNRSADDMAWYFYSGGELNLNIFEMAYNKFDDKYRGQQFSYIGIDEVPQMSFQKFKFLMTCNRNTYGIKSRIIGTCNPDPYSWLRVFIDWYLDDDGFVIPERSGKIRYFYSASENVEETIWGDSPEEVYAQCKDDIDKRWKPEYDALGYDRKSFSIKSFAFLKADLKYNKVLLTRDTNYLANLMNQPESVKSRELDGCWNPHEVGDDLIKVAHLERCFHNDEMTGDGIRRASCDVAFEGGDNCVLFLWIGWHVADVAVFNLNSMQTCDAVDAKLHEWGVLQQNFVYDLNGLGQTFKGYFPHAVPFNNIEAVRPKFKNVYDNVKSQCAYMFAQRVQNGGMSFNSAMLDRRFSGKGFEGRKLRDILLNERKAIKQDESKQDKGWCLIKKSVMKDLVGHSPDFIEALLMREYFDIKNTMKIPQWVNNTRAYR